MKVLVTGAGGFIGAAAVAALRTSCGEVRAGARRRASGATLCDLDRPETLPAALAGADLVVHCAYGDVARMAQQTQALVDAMTQAGVARLIYLSSIAVYGDAEGDIGEAAPLSARDPYGAAKIACETAARAFARDGRRAVGLRPGIVYGAGSRFWIDKLVERLRVGALGDLGPQGEGRAALIHVDDLAAMIAALARTPPGAPWVALNAVGPETPTWNAYFAALARTFDLPLRRFGPAEAERRARLALAAKAWRRLGLPGGRGLALAPGRGELALFSRRATYATDAAAALGAAAQIGLAEGLRRTARPAAVPQPPFLAAAAPA